MRLINLQKNLPLAERFAELLVISTDLGNSIMSAIIGFIIGFILTASLINK